MSHDGHMTTTTRSPIVLDAGAGDHRHFLNHLATTKLAGSQSDVRMSAVEFVAPRGFGPPLHQHREEDEVMYLAEGEMTLAIEHEGRSIGTGAVVFLPRQLPHTFQVTSPTARFLTVTAGSESLPSFDVFVSALGTPAPGAALPEPIAIDPDHVTAVCAEHGIEVLGPPPAPLD